MKNSNQHAPLVSIILLNWNGKEDTLECLESLAQLDYPNYKVILVDNASTDGLTEIVEKTFPHIILLKNTENLGFAEGNNVGIRHALSLQSEYVLLLNNDTVVEPSFLSRLVDIGERYPEIGMLSPYIYWYSDPEKLWFSKAYIDWNTGYANNKEWFNASPEKVPSAETSSETQEFFDDSDFLSGCALLVKTPVIQSIGELEARFFIYYEDVDWSVLCQKAGWKLAVIPSARIWHKSGASDGNSEYGTFLSYRNTVLFLWKHSNPVLFFFRLRRHMYRAFQEYSWNREQHHSSERLNPLDGIWAGLSGKYGKSRRKMPAWAQECCYRYYRQALWFTRSFGQHKTRSEKTTL